MTKIVIHSTKACHHTNDRTLTSPIQPTLSDFWMIWNLPKASIVYRHPTLVSSLLPSFPFHWEAIYCFTFLVFPLCPHTAGRFHTQRCCLWDIQKHKCPLGNSQILSAYSPSVLLLLSKVISGLKWAHFIRIITFQMIFIVM